MSGWWERRRRLQAEKLQDDRWHHLLDTRRKRRRLAGAGVLALALQWTSIPVIWFAAPSDLARNITISSLAISLMIYLPVVSLLNVATKGSTGLAEHLLDERQVIERRRAITVAHRATTWVLGGLFLTAALVTNRATQDTMTIPTAIIYPLAFVLWLTHYVLPLLIAGWRLPDPPPEDD
ncbi:hypothetical protein [Streptosporangium sp. KLBMP 9127]|nr:hypothetical protein [Streptosporangium sp. KLBMP 9127]